jgi:L-proline amide hydrolase
MTSINGTRYSGRKRRAAAEDMFVKELDNLVKYFGLHNTGFDLYGQSWGGMLGARYAFLQPKGLRKLVIANSPASVELVLKGEEALRAALPKDVRETIERCEREGKEDSEEYREAQKVFERRHMCRLDPPLPKEMQIAQKRMQEDPTVCKML